MNLSPENGSTTARAIGAANAAVFECDIFHEGGSGEILQTTTIWKLQYFQSESSILVIQSDMFMIGGTPQFDSFSDTYRNRIVVPEFPEALDRAVLTCGNGSREFGIFNLRVYRPPQLVMSVVYRVVMEGTAFSLDLSTGHDPFPYPREFRWTRSDGPLLRNASGVMWGYPSVTIRNVSRTNSGRYSLGAVNYRSDNTSEVIGRATGSFQLNVLYGPDIVKGPTGVVDIQGGETVLLCGRDLRSNPQASVVWSDNSGNIVDSSNTRISTTNSPASVSLLLRNLTEGDVGNWTCKIAVEGVGTLLVSIALIVVGPPSAPRGVNVTSSGATWSQFSWEEPSFPGFPASSTKLYVVVATRTGDGSTRESPSTANLSTNITGLLPNSEYELRVLAQSVVGAIIANSTPSGLALFNTTTTVPEMVCDVAPLSQQGVINVIWWYVHTGGLSLSRISLMYALSEPLPQFQPLGEVSVTRRRTLDGKDHFSSVVEDLTAGSRYIFRITSSNVVGNSSISCPLVFHSTGIPQKPELLSASSSSGSITIEVATNESGTELLSLFQFNIRAQHVVTLEVTEFEMAATEYRDGEVAELELTGFVEVMEGPVYLITVSCTNIFGTSEESDTQTVTIRFKADGLLVPIVGGAAVGLVVLTVIVIVLVITLGCICDRKGREREKRRYSPARNMESNSHQTKTSTHLINGGGINHTPINCLHTDKKPPQSPQYDIIPANHCNHHTHTVYDSLASAVVTPPLIFPLPPPSLPPPNSSMSSIIKPSLLDSANTSMGHLSQTSSIIRPKLRGSIPQVNFVDIKESRRLSVSVPDMLDQTIDYPLEFLEPNNDFLELEERFGGTGRAARRYNGHVIGFDQTSLGFDQTSLGIHSDA